MRSLLPRRGTLRATEERYFSRQSITGKSHNQGMKILIPLFPVPYLALLNLNMKFKNQLFSTLTLCASVLKSFERRKPALKLFAAAVRDPNSYFH
jgi:hypothetical protein